MSGFSAEWLSLREEADTAARPSALARTLRRRLGTAEERRVLDLGSGTGANLRYLAPRLGGRQIWRLVDNDPGLLEETVPRTARWAHQRGYHFSEQAGGFHLSGPGFAVAGHTLSLDLHHEQNRLPLTGCHLVTASALLDLVSSAWLVPLLGRCGGQGAVLCFALTYDGRADWSPPLPEDAQILALFNRHQCGDKGFGPALGPTASDACAARLKHLGCRVYRRPSDWCLGPAATRLQAALAEGIWAAAQETNPAATADLDTWYAQRRSWIELGRSTCRIGHQDLIAWPA